MHRHALIRRQHPLARGASGPHFAAASRRTGRILPREFATSHAQHDESPHHHGGFDLEVILTRQRWKLYAAIALWPVYVVVLPAVYAAWGGWVVLHILLPGVFLWSWLGIFAHECVHRYWPRVPHERLYRIIGAMILLDPEQFRRSHAIHHAQVNTYGDTMVYPFGRIARRPWRIAYAVGEVFGGDLFVFLATLCLPQRAGQQSGQKHGERRANFRPPAIVYSLAFFAATAAVSWLLLGVTIREIAVAYFLDLWLLGLVMRHNLMIQHRNVLSTAPHHQRAMLTRNLLAHGPLARLFLLLTHQECGNHVLHHVAAPLNARAAPHAVAVPAGAVYITLGDYARVLGQLLLGREPAGYGISGSSTFSKRNGTSTSSAPLTT